MKGFIDSVPFVKSSLKAVSKNKLNPTHAQRKQLSF